MKRNDTNCRPGGAWVRLMPAVLVWLSACAPVAATTGPETPAPGEAPPPPAEAPEAEAAAVGREEAPTADSIADLEARLVEMARAVRGPEPKLPPIKPFGVSWSPEPREGHAFSVQVYERPTGRMPVTIEGEFAGRRVRFARYGPRDRWFGVGVVPIGRSDPEVLTLRMTFEDGAVHEQTTRIAVEETEFPSSELRVDPRYSSPPPEVLERIRRERDMVREMLSTVTPEWRPDRPFSAPRPMDITSPFGQARTFNGELRSRHTGLDLRGLTGAPVHAAAAGRVAFAGGLYFAGNAVYIDHGLGVYTGYFHLSRIRVRQGEDVEAGRLLGDAGATGRVTGAHLHWYLSVDGEAADASSLLGMRLPD
jgi:hypothetical protein